MPSLIRQFGAWLCAKTNGNDLVMALIILLSQESKPSRKNEPAMSHAHPGTHCHLPILPGSPLARRPYRRLACLNRMRTDARSDPLRRSGRIVRLPLGAGRGSPTGKPSQRVKYFASQPTKEPRVKQYRSKLAVHACRNSGCRPGRSGWKLGDRPGRVPRPPRPSPASRPPSATRAHCALPTAPCPPALLPSRSTSTTPSRAVRLSTAKPLPTCPCATVTSAWW